MANCEACANARERFQEFLVKGMSEATCASIMKNTGFNPNYSPLSNNCADMEDLNDCFYNTLIADLKSHDHCDWESYIKDVMANDKVFKDVLICDSCGQWLEIEELWKAIEDLRKLIDALQNGRYTWLTPGVDYTCTFYNGWYTNGGYMRLGYIETEYQVLLRTESDVVTPPQANNFFRLKNPDLIANGVRQAHSTPIANLPACWIVGFNFIGPRAAWQNYDFVDSTPISTGIWNMSPNSLENRITWSANCPIHSNIAGTGAKLIHAVTQYHDGLNQQFTTYGLPAIECTGANMDGFGTLLKK